MWDGRKGHRGCGTGAAVPRGFVLGQRGCSRLSVLCSAPEDTLERPSPPPGFPAYGVALVVIGSLCIVTAPTVLLVRASCGRWAGRAALLLPWFGARQGWLQPLCSPPQCLGTKRLGWQHGRAPWNRRDPELGIHTLEMDNQGFWAEVSGLCTPCIVFCAWEFVFLQVTGSSRTC